MNFEDLKESEVNIKLPIKRGAMIELTGAKIKEICAQNPSHPLSIAKLKSIEGYPDTQKFGLEEIDVKCILENKEAESVESVLGGRKILQKRFKAKEATPLSPPTSKPKPTISSPEKTEKLKS